MGKLKNKKRFKPRSAATPRNVSSAADECLESEESNNKSAIENVEAKLQQPSPNDKIYGLQILTGVMDQPSILKEIVETKITRLIAPCLLDSCTSLRNVAAATLRNLSDQEDICDALVDQDIMTPVVAFIHKFSDGVKPDKKASKVSEDSDTFNHVINLLWNLCESSSVAVKYFNSEKLLLVLTRFLNPDEYRLELVISAAQCLLTASEENQNAVSILENEKSVVTGLFSLQGQDSAHLLLRTLAVGILYNISVKGTSGAQDGSVARYISILAETLVSDTRILVNQLTSQIPLEGSLSEEELSKINTVENTIDAQLTAVEILTNMFSSEDEEMMDEDGDDNEDGYSDDDISESGDPFVPIFTLPPEVQEVITSVDLITKLLSKLELPADNVCEILQSNKDCQRILLKFKLLQSRSLFCLNNLVSVLDVQALGGAEKLFSLWSLISQEVFKSFETREEVFLEAASSAMRAIILKLAAAKYSNITAFNTSDMEVMFNAARKCQYDSIRASLIRNISTLGSFFISSEQEKVLDLVGAFLIEVCNSSKEVWIIAEAVDALMDLYAEDETDASAARINLVQHLTTGAPILKSMIRSQKSTLGDHLPLVTTVQSNLGRFIKYKGKRISNMK